MSFKKTLVILAGGLGSRYNGLKQIDGIYNGYMILEYSLWDAINAGFNAFVLVINDKISIDFQESIKKKLHSKQCEVRFVIQKKEDFLPNNYDASQREKPWGTAHALLCALKIIQDAFFVINADDYYGKEIYKTAIQYFDNELKNPKKAVQIAFSLGNTLSENGSVSRGICKTDKHNQLLSIQEKTAICRENKDIVYYENNHRKILDENQLVSMNFWGFHRDIYTHFKNKFQEFIKNNPDAKAEYMLPKVVQNLLDKNEISVQVALSPSQWKGITYASDRDIMHQFLSNETQKGNYPEVLWS